MKQFLIKYRLANGASEQWHQDIAGFIAALNADPDLNGKVAYRCLKSRDGVDYYHLASAEDDRAISTLQSREFFKRYTERTKAVSGGTVEVLPLTLIAETKLRG
jgi:hypothetical protein